MTHKTEYHQATEDRFKQLSEELKTRVRHHNDKELEQFNILVAQNVLKEALEAILALSTPFSILTPQELAIRLSSYCISALPSDYHSAALYSIATVLPSAHKRRMAQGVSLKTNWADEGKA